ncbi:MAG: GHMP kinase [Candidatus Neomarinimicrobiota bacterium]|nr:GHMP kinase [Candidatus Neomarinimicrobiota bacterium]
MIITRTPFRISFAGGGTDLREFYSQEPGRVISTSIDKYIYVVIKRQLGIVEHKYRINWSHVEFKDKIEDIEHPIVREALKFFKVDYPIEITTFSDIPGQTGLGSSSSFAVGLVNALHALRGEMVTKHTLASEAAHIEVDVLGRAMGKQDHFAAAYGNLNVFTFNPDESVTVEPVLYRPEIKKAIESNLLMFYLKTKRDASDILKTQQKETQNKLNSLRELQDLVMPLRDFISNSSGNELNKFGEFLDKGWKIKRELTDKISSDEIDNYYQKAKDSGAIGGKLLGAGGGGFLLLYVEAKHHQSVIDALSELFCLPIGFDDSGTRITYYDQPMEFTK